MSISVPSAKAAAASCLMHLYVKRRGLFARCFGGRMEPRVDPEHFAPLMWRDDVKNALVESLRMLNNFVVDYLRSKTAADQVNKYGKGIADGLSHYFCDLQKAMGYRQFDTLEYTTWEETIGAANDLVKRLHEHAKTKVVSRVAIEPEAPPPPHFAPQPSPPREEQQEQQVQPRGRLPPLQQQPLQQQPLQQPRAPQDALQEHEAPEGSYDQQPFETYGQAPYLDDNLQQGPPHESYEGEPYGRGVRTVRSNRVAPLPHGMYQPQPGEGPWVQRRV
jgi:hypothetical protein